MTKPLEREPCRAACFRVSYRLIEDLLQLPEGHRIRRITSEFVGLDDACFVIEGPDLPFHHPGATLPEVVPLYTRDEAGRVDFAGWHQASRTPTTSRTPIIT